MAYAPVRQGGNAMSDHKQPEYTPSGRTPLAMRDGKMIRFLRSLFQADAARGRDIYGGGDVRYGSGPGHVESGPADPRHRDE
jgi:hypothetical protein